MNSSLPLLCISRIYFLTIFFYFTSVYSEPPGFSAISFSFLVADIYLLQYSRTACVSSALPAHPCFTSVQIVWQDRRGSLAKVRIGRC
ncbi:hypothetical protein BKA70DRAFT_1329135 [Coprinopsis sp. MPI-PUGE-AT-0042]|nr:hypothetical protein BKA70DRAFT_1329135 [Coprinopsis sp. MPI-PUGE-AT-0042]